MRLELLIACSARDALRLRVCLDLSLHVHMYIEIHTVRYVYVSNSIPVDGSRSAFCLIGSITHAYVCSTRVDRTESSTQHSAGRARPGRSAAVPLLELNATTDIRRCSASVRHSEQTSQPRKRRAVPVRATFIHWQIRWGDIG